MNIETNVVIWTNTGPSGALSVHVLNVDGTNTFTYNATSSDIFVQIRQAGTYYLDNIRMYRTYEDTIFVSGYEVDRAYRYQFMGYEGDSEVKGEGNSYTTEFRQYDPRVGRWLTIDPLANKFPWQSPYVGFDNNPIFFTDKTGTSSESTHLDEDGNVVAVYDDGDLGVYQHSNDEIQNAKNGMLERNSDNLVGVTLSLNSFKEGDKIILGSNWAEEKIKDFEIEQHILSGTIGPFGKTVNYALGARNGFKYDPKSDGQPFGSQISDGVYVSKRDVGNFMAGSFGRLSSLFSTRKKVLLVSYGAYQIADNKFGKMMKNFGLYYDKALNYDSSKDKNLELPTQKTYGEGAISNLFQRLGFENIKTLEDFNSRYSEIWQD